MMREADDPLPRTDDGGSIASILRTALASSSLLSRTPRAISFFFRPKPFRSETSMLQHVQLHGVIYAVRTALPVMASNGVAGAALFKAHAYASETLTHTPLGDGAVAAAGGGAFGGVVHACVVHPLQSAIAHGWVSVMRAPLRGLLVACYRDSTAFAPSSDCDPSCVSLR